MLDLNFNQVKNLLFVKKLALMLSRLELPTLCVYSRRDNQYTTDLQISTSSSKFISNVGLTRNKMLDLCFNQVKKHHFVKTLPWCCPGLNWSPLRVKQKWLPLHHSTCVLVLRSCIFISNVDLTRYLMHYFNFNQKKALFCRKISLVLSRLELKTFRVLRRRDNHNPTQARD